MFGQKVRLIDTVTVCICMYGVYLLATIVHLLNLVSELVQLRKRQRAKIHYGLVFTHVQQLGIYLE